MSRYENTPTIRDLKALLEKARAEGGLEPDPPSGPTDHPLMRPRMLATYGLASISGIGIALMAVEIFIVGALISILGGVGVASLYSKELRRLRIRVSYPNGEHTRMGWEIWCAIGIIGVCFLSPAAIYYYLSEKQLTASKADVATLQKRIADLEAPYWETLSPVDFEKLSLSLKQIKPRPIIVHCHLAQCRELARGLTLAFQAGGWQADLQNEATQDALGTGIYLNGSDETAVAVKRAIETLTPLRLTLETARGTPVSPQTYRLIIGLKPLK